MRNCFWYETTSEYMKDGLRNLLACNNIDYELSGSSSDSWWHFEISCNNDYKSDVISDWIVENSEYAIETYNSCGHFFSWNPDDIIIGEW